MACKMYIGVGDLAVPALLRVPPTTDDTVSKIMVKWKTLANV